MRGRLAVLVALAALLGGLALFALARAPLTLDALRPAIESALTPAGGEIRVRVEHTAILWRGGLRVLARGLQVLAGEDQVLGRFPEVAVSLSARALASGHVAVVGIELQRPVIRVVRERDGHLEIGYGRSPLPRSPEQSPILRLVEVMLGPADPSTALGALRQVTVQDAELEIEDRLLGITWSAPESDLELSRGSRGLHAEASLALDLAGRRSTVTVEVEHDRASGVAAATLHLAALDLERLAMVFPELGLEQTVVMGLPLSGTLTVVLRVDEKLSAVDVTELDFDLSGAAGSLELRALGLAPLALGGLRLAGRLHDDLTRLELSEAWLELGSTRLVLDARAAPLGNDVAVSLEARVNDFDVARLRDVWPPAMASDARSWVVPNIPEGRIVRGRFELAARLVNGSPSQLVIDSLGGSFETRRLVVHYLDPLPPATGVSTAARFDRKGFDFTLRGGRIRDVAIQGGDVKISGLDGPDQAIAIAGRVAGPLPAALAILDHDPLDLLSGLRFELGDVRGLVEGELRLDFPLEKDLRPRDVRLASRSTLREVEIENGPLGLTLSGGELSVEASQASMHVAGGLALAGEPAELDWREDFGDTEVASRVELTTRLGDDVRAALPWLEPDPIRGPVQAHLVYQGLRQGGSAIDLELGLEAAALEAGWIDWHKPAGVPATLRVGMRASPHALSIDALRIAGADLLLEATADLALDPFAVREIDLSTLRYPEGDLHGSLRSQEGGAYDVKILGKRFDLAPLLEQLDRTPRGAELPPFALAADLEQLRLGGETPLEKFHADVRYDGSRLDRARLDFFAGAPASASYAPAQDGRALSIRIGDLGHALQATSLGVRMQGGKLVVDGERPSLDEPLEGRFALSGFRVTSDVLIARLLQAFSLVDLMDALRRDGIRFRRFDGGFTYDGGTLALRDGTATGASLGLTVRGEIELEGLTAQLEGELLPLYTVNTAVSRIPVVGPVVAGEDGALLASSYRATGSLSALVVERGGKAPARKVLPRRLLPPAEGEPRRLGSIPRLGKPAVTPAPAPPSSSSAADRDP